MPITSRAPREESVTIATRPDGSLTVAAVADTHGAPHPRTLELLRAMSPDAILHAGDVGDLGVLDDLATIAPLYAVRGNIDGTEALPDVMTVDVVGPAGGAVLRVLLMHIAVNGPRLRADAARLARARDASLVVCGHSHVPFAGTDRGISVFNPGSVGPRRFQLPIVLGRIDVSAQAVRVGHVDCETGARWTPGPSPR